MVEIKLFHFRQKGNFLNNTHPLAKIISLFILSSLIAKNTMLTSLLLLICFIVISIIIKLPLRNFIKELRFFLIMALFMAIIKYVSTNSFLDALVTLLRFSTIVFMGLIFADTTASDDISRAIGNLLGPIFGSIGYKIGSTMELTLSTIYLLFDVSAQVSLARKARGESPWRNPIARVVSFSTTIFDLLLLKAQQLEEALIARNFDISKKRSSLKFDYKDALFVFVVALIGVILFIFT